MITVDLAVFAVFFDETNKRYGFEDDETNVTQFSAESLAMGYVIGDKFADCYR
jgi:hypothetical protein